MFMDLVKANKTPAKRNSSRDEISDERLEEIMAELFGSADDDDDEPAPMRKGTGYSARDKMLEKAEEDLDDDFEDEDEEDEDMEKGMSRREMMNQVYSMVDDLSDDELNSFLSDRQIKKAQVMAIFEQMPTSDLKELVSSRDANGASPRQALAMAKGSAMDDEDMIEDDEE
jgi:hypothetical protein